MPHIDYLKKEIAFKIVYYGPGLSGKTTNLVQVYNKLHEDVKGELVTLSTAQERTLFFDFFPMDLGRIGGYAVRFNLYTVPGQIYYEESRKLILDGADGVIFVADSQPDKLEDNLFSFSMMCENLTTYKIKWQEFPIVVQYNKRDCLNPIPIGTLEDLLDLEDMSVTEAVAIQGIGVHETIRILSKIVIRRFQI